MAERYANYPLNTQATTAEELRDDLNRYVAGGGTANQAFVDRCMVLLATLDTATASFYAQTLLKLVKEGPSTKLQVMADQKGLPWTYTAMLNIPTTDYRVGQTVFFTSRYLAYIVDVLRGASNLTVHGIPDDWVLHGEREARIAAFLESEYAVEGAVRAAEFRY